ncbi:MAG TPA: hypothetical protein VL120_11310 [Solirubrobacteraceae bacterium]|nr:hypothetical protein [Solirubrobacteraceae bacterium]
MRLLPNNNDFSGSSGYNWRVRAFDVDGNPGQWNRGPTFEKAYDNVTPTVPDVAVETVTTPDAAAASPLVTWSPVPGAAQYNVQWTTFDGTNCDWSNASGPVKTSSLAWTPLSPTNETGVPGGVGVTFGLDPNGTDARSGQPFFFESVSSNVTAFADGATYCVRVRALSDDSFRENDSATSPVISQWTQVGGGDNQPAFTYHGPPTSADPGSPIPQLPAPTYVNPIGGTVTHTPVLRWNAVPGARRYYVIVARDSNFTNVIDAAFTAMTAYAPNLVLEDEATSYFWAVIPSATSDGHGISGGPRNYNPQTFNKLSAPAGPVAPVGGVDVSTQPTFRWTEADGAQKYRVQVSADPQFGDLLDDVVTSSTAYTSNTPYPVDTVLYWRVRAEQLQALRGTRVALRWSDVGSFRRSLPAPSLADDIPLSGQLPPALTWTAVPGAISYDMHIDQADGVSTDFNVKSPAGTFTKFFGIGSFKFRVRANFGATSGAIASAYSAPRTFTRLISPPSGARISRSRTRLFFGWNPAAAATSYRVEVSTTESFASAFDSVTTNNTSWAPQLIAPDYLKRGALYWRVATVDDGGNTGAFTSGSVGVKKLTVRVSGRLRRNATSRLVVRVRGSGRALRSASVRASGSGVRTQTKRTSKRGTTSLRLRPTKTGTVTIVVSRTGYATRTVKVRVR